MLNHLLSTSYHLPIPSPDFGRSLNIVITKNIIRAVVKHCAYRHFRLELAFPVSRCIYPATCISYSRALGLLVVEEDDILNLALGSIKIALRVMPLYASFSSAKLHVIAIISCPFLLRWEHGDFTSTRVHLTVYDLTDGSEILAPPFRELYQDSVEATVRSGESVIVRLRHRGKHVLIEMRRDELIGPNVSSSRLCDSQPWFGILWLLIMETLNPHHNAHVLCDKKGLPSSAYLELF